FQVRNPFLFWTKAEMCQILAEEGKNDLVALTKSCDRPHRQQPIQCGYCSSCLLRRQALAASKIEDRTRYVICHGKRPADDPSVYLRHMLAQVHTLRCLINASDFPSLQWEALTQKFPVLDDIVDRGSMAKNLAFDDMRGRLIQLYRSYVTEWDDVESSLSVGLLNNIDQQSLDKCWSVA
ncbi:MAG: 7-cyano-7-deazaguanine synthase, partial [Phormidesmis sp.]